MNPLSIFINVLANKNQQSSNKKKTDIEDIF